jgi:hypothetical protein
MYPQAACNPTGSAGLVHQKCRIAHVPRAWSRLRLRLHLGCCAWPEWKGGGVPVLACPCLESPAFVAFVAVIENFRRGISLQSEADIRPPGPILACGPIWCVQIFAGPRHQVCGPELQVVKLALWDYEDLFIVGFVVRFPPTRSRRTQCVSEQRLACPPPSSSDSGGGHGSQ